MAGTISSAICSSAKLGLATKLYNFTTGQDGFKLALWKAAAALSASFGAAVTNYSDMSGNEVSGGNYTAGGIAITVITPQLTGTTLYWSFSNNPQWTAATFDTNGGLIYDTSVGNAAIATLSWGGDRGVTNGTFTVTWPTNDATNAVLRIT